MSKNGNRINFHQKKKLISEEKNLQEKVIDKISKTVSSEFEKSDMCKDGIRNITPKFLKNISCVFLVRRNNLIDEYYLMDSFGRKYSKINSKIIACSLDSFIGQAIIDTYKKSQRSFKLKSDSYQIIKVAIWNSVMLARCGIHSNDNLNMDLEEVKKIPIPVVYIYYKLSNNCMNSKHNIESVTVKTTNVRTGKNIDANVFYCNDCNRYFINYEALQGYIEAGNYPLFEYEFVGKQEFVGELRKVSELMEYGYNVREGVLTKEERQNILSWIIDSGFISKEKIIRDLQFKVVYNGKKVGNEEAKKKWKSDIDFVSHYTKGNSRKITAKFVR